jgi:tetratricopeptide (TPR) repeat protein
MISAPRFRCFLLAAVVLMAAPEGAFAGSGAPDRDGIERTLAAIEAGVASRDPRAVLAAYDPAASELFERTRSGLEAWLALEDATLKLRIGTVEGDAQRAEVVLLRRFTYREHDRDQVAQQWETVVLRRDSSGWKIASEEERDYTRCTGTDLQVELLPDRMKGSAALHVDVTAAGEDSLLLLLNRGLEVRSVAGAKGAPLPFQREADTVVVPSTRPLHSGDRFAITVQFEGSLFNESKEQGFSQVSLAPEGSFASWVTGWYPHLQGAGSKSKGRITYDVPVGITVASSGRPAERRADGERERQVFLVDRPLDFSFAAAKYFHRETSVDGTRLGVYLLSGGEPKADLYIREATRLLRFERSLYGDYPFDGYAVVEIPSEKTGTLGGSSEQGMNLFPTGVLPDDSFPLLLLGHEMGHSWWGNLVRSQDGPILDEGLAQITAVLSLREFQGEAAMRRFLKSGVPGYRQSASQYFVRFAGPQGKDFPIGVAPAGADAESALHDIADTKGMFVYAMLRDLIGQEAFVSGLRATARRFAGKSVRVDDLRAAWEKAARRDLGPFFNQWFRRTGAPDLTLTSTVAPDDSGFLAKGTVTQSGEPYELWVEIALATPGWREVKSIAVTGASTDFSFKTERKPEWVVLDPEYKVLRWTPAFRNYALLGDGLGLWSTGKREEAIAKIEEYVSKVPESLEGRYRLGVCYEESGKLDEAERCFRWVLDRYAAFAVYEPAVSLSQLHLGHVLDLRSRRDEAKEAYEKTLALPDESDSHKEATALLASPFQPPAPHAGPGQEILARFAGSYDNGNGIVLDVRLKETGILMVAQPGKPEGALEWIDGSRFRVAGASDITLEFLGGPQVDALDLKLSGNTIHLPRAK